MNFYIKISVNCGSVQICRNDNEIEVVQAVDTDEMEREHEVQSPHAVDVDQMLPGLPGNLVLSCILPRIPWHTRPHLQATCRAWSRALIDASCYSTLTRKICQEKGGLVVAYTVIDNIADEHRANKMLRNPDLVVTFPKALCLYQEKEKIWRRLPPISELGKWGIPQECGIVCMQGKVMVIGGRSGQGPCSADMYMLDVGGGMWKWQRMSSLHFPQQNPICIGVGMKVYVVPVPDRNGPTPSLLPEMYDVATNEWLLLPEVFPNSTHQVHDVITSPEGHLIVYGATHDILFNSGSYVRTWNPLAMTWETPNYGWHRQIHLDCNSWRDRCRKRGDYMMRDGILYKFDKHNGRWQSLVNNLDLNHRENFIADMPSWDHWRFDELPKHFIHVVDAFTSKPRIYAINCSVDPINRMWLGEIDDARMEVSWQSIKVPKHFKLVSVCPQICYLP